jgi:uncharacterized protein (TIRG00374 family)
VLYKVATLRETQFDLTDNDKRANRGQLKRTIMALLGIGLSAAGLWYVFRGVSLDDLWATTDRIRVLPLLGSLAVYWLGVVVFRSLLVKHLLKSVGPLGFFQAYRFLCIGFLANNVLPFRAGDMARAAAISRGAKLSFPSVVGGLALERMLDLAMVAIVGLVAIQVAPLPESIQLVALISAVVLVAALIAFTIVARGKWKEKTPDPEHRIRAFVWNLWVRFSAGFGALGTARGVLAAAALSVAIWAIVIVSFLFRLASFGIEPSLPLVLVVITSLGFGVAVPSAPGFVGVYHAAVTFSLELFGYEHDVAVGFGLMSWIVDIGVGSTFGAVSLSMEGFGLRDLRRKEEAG